jgi:hypothetical protein
MNRPLDRWLVGPVCLALLLVGCAGLRPSADSIRAVECPSPSATPSSSPTVKDYLPPDVPSFNFADPWHAERISFQEAEGSVEFPVYEPQSLGAPLGAYVARTGYAMALTYDSDCGPVVLIEGALELDPSEWESSIADQVAQFPANSPGEVKIDRVGTTDGLVTVSADNRSVAVEWLQGQTQLQLLTPEAIENQAVGLAQGVFEDIEQSPRPGS